MKRILLAFSLVLLIAGSGFCIAGSSAIGIYGDYGIGTLYGTGLGLTFRINPIPIMWGAEWNLTSSGSLEVNGDFWVINEHLAGALDFYIGVGAFIGVGFGSGSSFDFGGRIPIGLQFYPVSHLEVFLEGAPLLFFLPGLTLGADFRLGIRVHF